MSVRINDTFTAGQLRFHELLKNYSGPEPEYVQPKVWPHQVPPERRIKVVREVVKNNDVSGQPAAAAA